MSLILSLIGIVPPEPRIRSITPCQNRNPASVTTNEGSPIRVMIVPCSRPMPAHASSADGHRAHHGQPWSGDAASAMITAADAGHEADREVDLAQQQHEHLGHRQQA